MDQISNGVQAFDKTVGNVLDKYVKTPTFVKAVVHLLLMLYVARIAPSPPKPVLDLFENIYFRLFVFSMVLWTAQFSPSTSILIALAFLVTVNYTTTGKVWELLENTQDQNSVIVPVTPTDSANAVEVLAEAASNSSASTPEDIGPVANIAMANSTSQEGVDAIKALAQQAVVPESGAPEKVQEAVSIAVESILPAAAAVAVAEPVVVAEPVAKVEVSGHDAAQALSPVASAAPVVAKKAKSEGCYPMRLYDMSKVMPQMSGELTAEDYQPYVQSS
jgi:hypothetical protein